MRVGNSWSEGWVGAGLGLAGLILWRGKLGGAGGSCEIKGVREPQVKRTSATAAVPRAA
jgi:hypothetical protein